MKNGLTFLCSTEEVLQEIDGQRSGVGKIRHALDAEEHVDLSLAVVLRSEHRGSDLFVLMC